jgi:nitrile hydratase accessory protein
VSAEAVVSGMELPRSNGELVFAAPWESRAFGLAVAVHEGGAYEWRDFSETLGAEIGARPADDGSGYYERWLATFERVLRERGLVTEAEIAARAAELAAQDDHDDHDHHDHGDHHGHHHHPHE